MWRKVRDSNPESVTGQRFSRPPDYQLSQPCVFRTLIQNRTELTANLLRVYIENYHCMSSKTAIVVILNIRKDFTMKLYNQAQSHKRFCRWAKPAGGICRTWTHTQSVMSRQLLPVKLISLMMSLSWHPANFIIQLNLIRTSNFHGWIWTIQCLSSRNDSWYINHPNLTLICWICISITC